MRVFVSSTFEDLRDHRQAVDEILSRLSVQFKGMEYFGARPFEPKKVCSEEIAACKIFVGIYAHRYGWIPPGDSASITEQEFDFARKAGLSCYCYVVDPDHPWPPRHIEYGAADKLKHFLAKVNVLVRAKFTTPDNLAKQVAADLKAVTQPDGIKHSRESLIAFLDSCCRHEITTSIGPKYIRDLYVGRQLDRTLSLHLSDTRRTVNAAQELLNAISGLTDWEGANSNQLQHLRDNAKRLGDYCQMSPHLKQVNYPAEELSALILDTKKSAQLLRQAIDPQRYRDYDRRIAQNVDQILERVIASTEHLSAVLRPVNLVVDRAGGGKTNVLCHLTEVFASELPCFFVAAKSIQDASEGGILQYLSSAYPVGVDPIATALDVIGECEGHVILIVDGINEHFSPRAFNAALKAFVRRYYHRPVKFVVSCRDIYWNYFEDDWWISHGERVSRDALYSFTRIEYRQALPLYLDAYDIEVQPGDNAREQLHHPLLLRFFCEAFKGSPHSPTILGRLSDLRLLELFDAYCSRKFKQIKERLGLLDGDEVMAYLRMIATLMLDAKNRMLPINTVASRALRDFGETSLKRVDSRYIQILDEDILIEERPVGHEMDVFVTFVYDEFMEYTIARTVWSDTVNSNNPTIATADMAKKLLAFRDQFISVVGVVMYLAEILAAQSEASVDGFLQELVAGRQEVVVVQVISRILTTHQYRQTFSLLLHIHKKPRSRRIRYESWLAIERLAARYLPQIFTYVIDRMNDHAIRPRFCILNRNADALSPAERLAGLHWIADCIPQSSNGRESELDRATGLNAARHLLESGNSTWSSDERWLANEVALKIGVKVSRADLTGQ